MSRFGRWTLALLLIAAGSLAGWAAAVRPWRAADGRPAPNVSREVAYLGELQVALVEHNGALYRTLAAPQPGAPQQLDHLEGYLGEGAAWLGRRGVTGAAQAVRAYLQAAAGARTADREQASQALTGPLYQALTQARSALGEAAGRLEASDAPPPAQDFGVQGTALALLALLCGLGALAAILTPAPQAPANEQPAPPESLTGARLRAEGLVHSGAAAALTLAQSARSADELRTGLEAIAAASNANSAVAANLSGAAHQVHRSLGRLTGFVRARQGAGTRLAGQLAEVAEAVGVLADRAGEAGSGAAELYQAASSAADAAQSAAQSTAELEAQAARTALTLGALVERAGQIESVLGAMKSIAVQTNMLALNAAVEAARAGERGRGFAVVADSVRKLSLEAQRRAQEIDQRVAGLSETAQRAAGEAQRMRELAGAVAEHIKGSIADFKGVAGAAAGEGKQISSLAEALQALHAQTSTAAAALTAADQAAPAADTVESAALQLGLEARQLIFAASEMVIALQELQLEAGIASSHASLSARTARDLELGALRVAQELRTLTASEPKG